MKSPAPEAVVWGQKLKECFVEWVRVLYRHIAERDHRNPFHPTPKQREHARLMNLYLARANSKPAYDRPAPWSIRERCIGKNPFTREYATVDSRARLHPLR